MCETTFIEVNGAAIRYALSGKGPQTLVLFHETGGSLDWTSTGWCQSTNTTCFSIHI